LKGHLLKVNPSVKIYAPQENFGVFGAALPGTFYRRDDSLPPEMRYFDGNAPEKLRFGSPWPEANFTWIGKDTEIAPGFTIIALTGKWGADFELREISLAMDTPDGVVLVVGCSHTTIEKIVQQAKATINKPIHLILGGLHLLPAKDDQIKAIAAFLHDDAKVEFIAPAHCTGEPAFAILKDSFGDKYVYTGLGSTTVVGEKVTVKLKPASRLSTRWTLMIIEAIVKPWLPDLIAHYSADGAILPQRPNKESRDGTSSRF